MPKIATIGEFLDTIAAPEHRAKMEGLLEWVSATWPALSLVVKWNQPMFTDHGTYIIGFSVYPRNIAVSPEDELMDRLRTDIEAAGYSTTKRLFRIGWDDPIDRGLLRRLVDTQIAEKSAVSGFWRP